MEIKLADYRSGAAGVAAVIGKEGDSLFDWISPKSKRGLLKSDRKVFDIFLHNRQKVAFLGYICAGIKNKAVNPNGF